MVRTRNAHKRHDVNESKDSENDGPKKVREALEVHSAEWALKLKQFDNKLMQCVSDSTEKQLAKLTAMLGEDVMNMRLYDFWDQYAKAPSQASSHDDIGNETMQLAELLEEKMRKKRDLGLKTDATRLLEKIKKKKDGK